MLGEWQTAGNSDYRSEIKAKTVHHFQSGPCFIKEKKCTDLPIAPPPRKKKKKKCIWGGKVKLRLTILWLKIHFLKPLMKSYCVGAGKKKGINLQRVFGTQIFTRITKEERFSNSTVDYTKYGGM